MASQQLSSDILEAQFGPTTVRVLHQSQARRVIQTIATTTNQVLELSLVRFVPEGVRAFPEIHATIVAGQSMGKAFRTAGVEFMRREQYAGYCDVPKAIQHLFGSEKALVVAVGVFAGPAKTPYATITETYTGEVTWPTIFGTLTPAMQGDLRMLAQLLART